MDPVLLTLLACADPPADPPAPEPEAPSLEPSPWTFEDEATGDPPVDLALLGRALDQAIVDVLTYSAVPVVDGYAGLYATSGEPTCPAEVPDGYGGTYWQDSCTTSDGTTFGGYLSRYDSVDYFDPGTGTYLDGVTLLGNVVVTGPAGSYDMEGTAVWLAGESPDGAVRLVQSVLLGGFSHLSPDATGWLRDAGNGQALSVTLVGYALPAYDATAVVVDAAVQVEVDGEPYSVVLDYLQLGNEAVGSLCGEEPGGSVSIRDPYGRWVEATFDGPDLAYFTTLGDPARCEGCGDATLDGEPVGALCASFDRWYQWEEIR